MARTKIWAHRGAAGFAPENTMEAFFLANRMKADGIELDIQLTKDGQVVVTHDETIDRVSDGEGWVKDYTLEELRMFNFNKTNPVYGRLLIPTLEEVYAFIKNTDMQVNVEVKTGVIFYKGIEEKALEIAKRMKVRDRIIYSSFNHYSVLKIKEIDSSAQTGILFTDGFIDIPRYAKNLGIDAVHPYVNHLEYPGFLEDCQKYGIKVNVWTVDSGKQMRRLCDANKVDTIITNFPDKAREIADDYPIEIGQ